MLTQDVLISSCLLLLAEDVSCGAVATGRTATGEGPGRSPQPAVWLCASVLRPAPFPCRGAAPCRLCLVAGGGGWCCCGAATHAVRSVVACNWGQLSLMSSSMSGLSLPVLPHRLWQVVCWVSFLSDVISGVEIILWEGCYPASAWAHGVCVIVYV